MERLEDVAGHMQKAVQQTTRGKSSHGSYDDMLRLFAAMEAVPWQYRQEMGQWMLQRLKRPMKPCKPGGPSAAWLRANRWPPMRIW